YGLRRARARLSALPPRTLCRVQSGVGPRDPVRPAVGRADGIDPDVLATLGALALWLAAGAGDAGGATLRGFPAASGLGGGELVRRPVSSFRVSPGVPGPNSKPLRGILPGKTPLQGQAVRAVRPEAGHRGFEPSPQSSL